MYTFEIVKRSNNFVWLKYHDEITRRKIRIRETTKQTADGWEKIKTECCDPLGSYSMSPILDALDIIPDAKTAEEAKENHRKKLVAEEQQRRQQAEQKIQVSFNPLLMELARKQE